MEKYCAVCGRLIAREVIGEYYDVIRGRGMSYYAWIRRKYCPTCATEVQYRKKLDWAHEDRRLNRKYHKKMMERLDMVEAENGFLRALLVESGVL